MDITEYQGRRARLAKSLAAHDVDALLVSARPNVRYLTGFTGSNGAVLFARGKAILVTDPRYELQASRQTDCPVRIAKGPLAKTLASLMRRHRLKKIAFEADRLRFATYQALDEALPLGAELVPTRGVVEELRRVKSEAEIQLIRRSVAVCAEAFERVAKTIGPGLREQELAAEIDYQMRKLGAEQPSFDTIVASGPRSALPHAAPTDRTIHRNELLLIDMGAQREGYASDMTRMLHLGRPSRRVERLYRAVREAQQAGIEAVRPGASAATVDRRARQVLRDYGLADRFVHSTGHGLGLEIHEEPRIGRGNKTRLEAGMVITVEPGVYLEGLGGIRIEDTILVTETGAEVLTPVTKELRVI